ncbi:MULTISPECIES: Hpt domain-containing protein [unclassified Pseudomonas]|uniref:Hpt domain-containing protein n=1 Tax=unclassified Pseudomonas TaxID=196821 RepID=UPI0025D1FF53|nr:MULTISPECIES: Hpt domain-containing protein [unclassified Pseudomonas]
MQEHVDLTVLDTLRDVMETEYPALLHIFIRDSETRITDMNALSQAADFSAASPTQLQQLGLMAHSFKGSSSNMGAVQLTALCRQLEDLVRGQAAVNAAMVTQLVQAIDSEFRVVRDLFDVELQTTLTSH